jgi:hypothetical protein
MASKKGLGFHLHYKVYPVGADRPVLTCEQTKLQRIHWRRDSEGLEMTTLGPQNFYNHHDATTARWQFQC